MPAFAAPLALILLVIATRPDRKRWTRVGSALCGIGALVVALLPVDGRTWSSAWLIVAVVFSVAAVVASLREGSSNQLDGLFAGCAVALVAVGVTRTLAPPTVLREAAGQLPRDAIEVVAALFGLRSGMLTLPRFALALFIVGSVLVVMWWAKAAMTAPVATLLVGGALGGGLHLLVLRARGVRDVIDVPTVALQLAPFVLLGLASLLLVRFLSLTERRQAAAHPGTVARDVTGPAASPGRRPVFALIVALGGMLASVQSAAIQHQLIGEFQQVGRFGFLAAVDRSIEVLLWSALVVAVALVLRQEHTVGPRTPGVLTPPPPDDRSGRAASKVLLIATGVMLLLHAGVGIWTDGLTAAPLRPLAVLLALTVVATFGPRPLTLAVLIVLGASVTVSLALGALGVDGALYDLPRGLLPGFAFTGGRLRGLFGHPNTLGAVTATVLAAALMHPWKRRWERSLLLSVVMLLAGLVLPATDSQTAAYAIIAGVLAWTVGRLVLPARLGTPVMLGLAVSAATVATVFPFVAARNVSEGAFTGRVHLWNRILSIPAEERRWGLGSSPLFPGDELRAQLGLLWEAADGHNLTMEMLLVAGLPGVVASTLFYVAVVWAGLAARERSAGWSLFAAAAILALSSMEAFFLSGPGEAREMLLVLVGLLLAAGLGRDPQSPSRTRAAATSPATSPAASPAAAE